MQWKVINGWYCVTACGLMSWKFRTLGEAMNWVHTSRHDPKPYTVCPAA